jgi:hypothetical protein
MATLSDKEWLTKTYQDTLLRDPTFGGKLADGRDDPGDADYWLGQLAGGTSRGTVFGQINASPESNELRQGVLDLSNTAGNTQSVAERYQTSRDNTALGGSAMAEAKKNYTGIFTDYSKTSDTTDTTDTTTTDTTTTDTSTAATSSGLTLDDLNSWWDKKQVKQPDKFDQFKEFMGLMGGMGGFGGGGVPGFASGGVAAASPYNNFMGFMNAFKSLGGGSQQADISTSNIN